MEKSVLYFTGKNKHYQGPSKKCKTSAWGVREGLIYLVPQKVWSSLGITKWTNSLMYSCLPHYKKKVFLGATHSAMTQQLSTKSPRKSHRELIKKSSSPMLLLLVRNENNSRRLENPLRYKEQCELRTPDCEMDKFFCKKIEKSPNNYFCE